MVVCPPLLGDEGADDPDAGRGDGERAGGAVAGGGQDAAGGDGGHGDDDQREGHRQQRCHGSRAGCWWIWAWPMNPPHWLQMVASPTSVSLTHTVTVNDTNPICWPQRSQFTVCLLHSRPWIQSRMNPRASPPATAQTATNAKRANWRAGSHSSSS